MRAPDGRALPVISAALSFGGGDFEPDAITERVGLQPTLSYRRGDPGVFDRARRRDLWAVQVPPREILEVQPVLEELVGAVDPYVERIRATCKDLHLAAQVDCIIELRSTLSPEIRLLPATLRWLSILDATLDVDVMTWEIDER